MTRWPWAVLAASSVTVVGAVNAVAVALGPDDSRLWLLFCGVMALAAALQSVLSEPRDLAPALLLSVPPVMALLSEGSPTWLIGPLGASLLVAGELHALSWECQGADPTSALRPRRLAQVGLLASLGIVASLLVGGAPRIPTPGGTAAVAVAAVALAALGGVLFRRPPERATVESRHVITPGGSA